MDYTLAFLTAVINRLKVLYDDFSNKLTVQRAGYMDSLPNLVAPAALSSDVGSQADAQALNTTLFAAHKELYNQLVTLDQQMAILASAELVRTVIVPGYTPISLVTAANAPVTLSPGGTTIQWPPQSGAVLHTVHNYGLLLPAQAMPRLFNLGGVTGKFFSPIILPQMYGTLALTINAPYPTTVGAGVPLVSFGDPTASNWWGVVGQQGGGVALATAGTVTALQGNPFPLTVHWDVNGLTALNSAGTVQGQIAASRLPLDYASNLYNLYIQNNATYVIAVDYI